MKSVKLILIIASMLTLSGCADLKIKSVRDETNVESSVVEINTIEIKDDRLIPDKITVALEETVVFINHDKDPITIASDPHPDHSDLPDLYSPPIYQGSTYNYTFKKEGFFGFHLEHNPSISGLIVVISPKENK